MHSVNVMHSLDSDGIFPCSVKHISIGNYFPEVRAFGTLIRSTEVFRII